MSQDRDRAVLDALARACADERGGWATPLPVADYCGLHVSGVNQTLRSLVEQGRAESWSPQGGKNKLTYLYRPA